MTIRADPSSLAASRWFDFLLRFLFGGLITVGAGLILKRFGPEIGGLFLAFPAIFPAAATLIEKRERTRKKSKGMRGARRGKRAAGAEAAGTTIGSFGLMVFAATVWALAPGHAAWLALTCALAAWLIASCAAWYVIRG